MKGKFFISMVLMTGFIFLNGGFLMSDEFPLEPGTYEMVFKPETGKVLRYGLSIPEGLTADKAAPLVIALHYGGPVSPYYGKSYMSLLVEPGLEKLKAIIAAPDCPAGQWNNPPSETAVLELVKHLKKNYSIDENRVVLTGFSLGGIGTYYLAARHPDLFSAAIPMAADTDRETAKLLKDFPLFVINSTGDKIFPIEQVRETVEMLKESGAQVRFEVIKKISHYQTAAFAEPLKKAVFWLKKTWKNSNPEKPAV